MRRPLSAKIMSLSTQTTKFLLDENVQAGLLRLLRNKGYDAVFVRRQATDKELAQLSLEEGRILVTNDEDFSYCSQSEIFAVVWLRIPQADFKALCDAFFLLLRECNDFSGKLILLEAYKWRAIALGEIENL